MIEYNWSYYRGDYVRKRLFEIIEIEKYEDRVGSIYDIFMTIIILLSLVPMIFKETNHTLFVIEYVCIVIFIIDYLLRWFTADLKLDKGVKSFIFYPFTFLGIN